ncbi:hypothetical protein [Saccharopolyspora rhizosphaerae]|nr:hypothetical protein [Saccharopolyspora rhizosphaerae]
MDAQARNEIRDVVREMATEWVHRLTNDAYELRSLLLKVPRNR